MTKKLTYTDIKDVVSGYCLEEILCVLSPEQVQALAILAIRGGLTKKENELLDLSHSKIHPNGDLMLGHIMQLVVDGLKRHHG